MAYEQTSVKIVVDVQNRDQIDLLKKQVTDLEKATRSGGLDLTSYVEKIRDTFKASTGSSEALKAQIALWEKIRSNVNATNPVFAQASAEIVNLRKNLDQLNTAYTHVSEAANKAATSATGNVSDLTRRYLGMPTLGGAQASESPFGPQELNYRQTNAALDAMLAADNQIAALERRARQEQLETQAKYDALELDANKKKWAEELAQNDAGFQKELAQFNQALERRSAVRLKEQEAEAQAEREAAERKANRAKFLENVGLGIGFPLMFGGGPGAILGGGLGSLVGEGFAGQIIGSAIGTKFDEFTKSATDFAKAMREGGDAAGYLKETLGYLSPEVDHQIKALQQAGQTGEAAKVAFDELAKQIGTKNAQSFKDFGTSWDQFVRTIKNDTIVVIGKLKELNDYLVKNHFYESFPGIISSPAAPAGSSSPAAPAGSSSSWLPPIKEPAVTQEARDKLELSRKDLEIAKAKNVAAATVLHQNIELYTVTQKRIAQEEYEKSILEITQRTRAQGLTTEQDSLEKQIARTNLLTRFAEIDRQAQEQTHRQAKEQLQIRLQSIEAGTQALQAQQEALSWGKTDLQAARDKLKLLDKVDVREKAVFEKRKEAALEDAALKNTTKETTELFQVQYGLLLQQQIVRRQNQVLAIAELEASEKTTRIQRQGTLLSSIAQGNATNVGLQAGIARSLGLPTGQFDRAQLEYQQQARYLQQVITPQAEVDVLRNKMQELESKGKDVTLLREEVQYKQNTVSAAKQLLSVQNELEKQQQRINEVTEKYGFFFDAIGQGMSNTFDLLVKGTNDWGNSLRNIAATVLQDIAKQLLKIYVIDQSISFLKSAIGGIGGGPSGGSNVLGNFNLAAAAYGSANGNVFAANGIVPYAMGGIVDRPTIFPFAKGVGLMGEAGPEAIIPLKRGTDGKLGVSGGSGTSVVVNVDAKGTSVQGDNTQSAALGRAVSQAVQAELIKQRRPGGLLAA